MVKSNSNIKAFLNQLGLAGLISSLCLFFSWTAIILCLNEQYKLMIIAATVAFLLDALDGYVARRLNKESELGRQLDGMIDVVNYSLLAAIITWKVLLPGIWGYIVGFIILLTGILRLIRFDNEGFIEINKVKYYRGILVCYLSLTAITLLVIQKHIYIPVEIIGMILVIVSILQLSNIKTRKTGVLPFWMVLILVLMVVSLLWL